jgi:hypothetical protein
MKDTLMITQERDIDKLRTINKRVKKSDREIFAPTLCEFLDELGYQDLIEALDKYATTEEDKDTAVLLTREKDLLQALRSQNEKIELYYAEHSITLPQGFMGKLGTGEFQSYEQGKIINSNCLVDSLIQAIGNELSFLMHVEMDGTKEEISALVEKLAVIAKDGRIMLRDTSIEGLQKAYTELHDYVTGKKILHHRLMQYLEEFCKSGTRQEDPDRILRQNSALVSVLIILRQESLNSTHHLDFVEQYASVNNTGDITQLTLAPTIELWRMEKRRIERIQTGMFWHQWRELKRFHDIYKNYEPMRYDAFTNGLLFAEWQLCDDFKKIDGIVSTKQQHGYMQTLKAYQQRIFDQIETMLLLEHQTTSIVKQNIKQPATNPNPPKIDIGVALPPTKDNNFAINA